MLQILSGWAELAAPFWILWGIQAVFLLWWLFSDLRQTHLPMNPSVVLGFAWLVVALLLHLATWRLAALAMLCITGAPLALMAVFLLLIFVANLFGPVRWN